MAKERGRKKDQEKAHLLAYSRHGHNIQTWSNQGARKSTQMFPKWIPGREPLKPSPHPPRIYSNRKLNSGTWIRNWELFYRPWFLKIFYVYSNILVTLYLKMKFHFQMPSPFNRTYGSNSLSFKSLTIYFHFSWRRALVAKKKIC